MELIDLKLAEGKQYARLVTLLELASECAVATGEHEIANELDVMIVAGYSMLRKLDKEVQGLLNGGSM